MAVDFESSQTKKNLEAAFAGESMATNKYAYFASKAKKDGFVQISQIFTETPQTTSILFLVLVGVLVIMGPLYGIWLISKDKQ